MVAALAGLDLQPTPTPTRHRATSQAGDVADLPAGGPLGPLPSVGNSGWLAGRL